MNENDPSNDYGIQLGPDGKIYIALYGAPYLSVINNPNEAGINCNYTLNGLSLGNNNASYGLPNFVDSFGYGNTTYDCVVGVENVVDQNEFVLFPNPANDVLTIQAKHALGVITIIDMQGKIVLITQCNSSTLRLDISGLASGAYVVRVGGKVMRVVKE
ncbi:MAG: T9SS type A sorting domain-containing protein [Flavobacteriales bacterium]